MTDPADPPAQPVVEPDPEPAPEPAPLLTLRDGLPPVVETEAALARVCDAIAGGTGPVAVDAERASGYRYSARAYLVQLRRTGSGSALVDPIHLASLAPLTEAIGDAEWILHAATQDLPCLAAIGLRPVSVFDTELAGRLLGYPRVGLATLVEATLDRSMRKEHSAVDWSTRPLPEPWLEYAALDVEVLVELRDVLAAELEEAGKSDWARQEFDHLLDFQPTVRVEPWRRTSGMHRVRGRRGLAAVRALWETRDRLARETDVTPGRIIPDSAVVEGALALTPSTALDRRTLLSMRGFHGRGAGRYAKEWLAAIEEARLLPEADLPARSPRVDGPPPPRAWVEKDPVAAQRLALARPEIGALAGRLDLPTENLLTPDYLRRVLWEPPVTRDRDELVEAVDGALTALGARPWQRELTVPLLVDAILGAESDAVPQAGSAAR